MIRRVLASTLAVLALLMAMGTGALSEQEDSRRPSVLGMGIAMVLLLAARELDNMEDPDAN